jgi:protein involved in polysaccharide export with SLBB domain
MVLSLATTDLFAQGSVNINDLNAVNLSNIRAADISDQQLKTFVERANRQGISIDQALELAVTRGLSASEAQELRSRITGLQDEVAVTAAEDAGGLRQQVIEDLQSERTVIDESSRSNIFGANLFRNQGFNLTPSLNIPTPENYQLGTGDQLIVTIWGDRTDRLTLTVDPEGAINLQNRGPIYVNGLTIEAAKKRLMDQLVQLYSGLKPSSGQPTTFAEVSLGRVRTVSVVVTGEVQNPGTYNISSLATVFNALYVAGGPNGVGSFRNIRVLRNNEVEVELDLYDFLLYANQTNNIRLRDQDVVQVLPFEQRVSIEGNVLRPAVYELKGRTTYSELLEMAGGFSINAYTHQIQIRRFTDTQKRIVTVPKELYADFTLMNGDIINVPEVLDRFENRVSIEGAVWRPGEFELKEGMTLSELIAAADGVRPDAFTSRGLINRVNEDLTFQQIAFNLEDVLRDPARFDVALQREDEVVIRGVRDLRDEAVVEVGGAVRESGVFVWMENMTLQDLILKSNGFRDSAALDRIEIYRRSSDFASTGRLVETISLELSADLSVTEQDLKLFRLQPYDVVYVFTQPDFRVQQFVTIEGEVRYPGRYAIKSQNEKISDLITRAGGLTGEAYLPGARINRLRSSIDRASVNYDFLGQDELLEVSTSEQSTRIGVQLDVALRNPSSPENLALREGDVIRVPKRVQTVRVLGAVMQEVEVRYVEGAGLSYYINRAGGYQGGALKKRSYVVYANGDIDRNRRFLGMNVVKPDIQPGAEIIVPFRPERDRMTAQETVALSSMIISTTTSLLFLIDRLSR